MRFAQFEAGSRILPQSFQDSARYLRGRNARFPAVPPKGLLESGSQCVEACPPLGGTWLPRDSAFVDLLLSTLLGLRCRTLFSRSKHADCIQRLDSRRDEENQLSSTFQSVCVFEQIPDNG